jgi:YggT family protein
MDALQNASLFLINTLFDLMIFLFTLRAVLCWCGVHYFNPLSHMIIKLTQPLVTPLRRFLPTRAGFELSTLLIIFLLEYIKFFLIGLLSFGMPNILGLIILSIADPLKLIVNIFFYAILAQAILSWVYPQRSPATELLSQLTAPIMRPIQRFVPLVGGFDISPIPALLLLQLILILFVAPLFSLGMEFSFG